MATSFSKAWKHRPQTRRAAKTRKWLKNRRSRQTRRLGKQLEPLQVRLNAWDVL